MRNDGLSESVKQLASIKLTEISERLYGVALNNHKDDNQPGLARVRYICSLLAFGRILMYLQTGVTHKNVIIIG